MALQQSDGIMHVSPGWPVPPPRTQQTLSTMSQVRLQHWEFVVQ
jgi:hypothetical protein